MRLVKRLEVAVRQDILNDGAHRNRDRERKGENESRRAVSKKLSSTRRSGRALLTDSERQKVEVHPFQL